MRESQISTDGNAPALAPAPAAIMSRTGWNGYPPILVGASALGWIVASVVSVPLERMLLRAGASRANSPATALKPASA